MKYKQVRPRKIYEEVAETILEMIKKGEIKPGEKLDSVEQLAENFNVGRSAIREALSALRAMGMIDIKQGEGTYVKEFDPDVFSLPLSSAALMNKQDISYLLEVRRILETGAARAAAEKRTEADLEDMQIALGQMKEAVGNEELGEQADLLFHIGIAAASHNPILVNLMNHVSGMLIESMRETRRILLYSKRKNTDRLYDEHVEIFEAIQSGDSDTAEKRMLQHLENVEKVLTKYFLEKDSSI
ncbi:FadR/GntR family transcriptional regulator [Metabacillus arenae]|uniref:FadR family transcriptional regulator n=1 Tax=Metabacillus arenae TaxID=2771434 RepID=A0A926NFV4_9BACI|nr:FadR/GntR family transcriptional regulator [Metabacillus arenae]MBD1380350.1 FadR family transcriptional regulator [Metabacillus arenae]